MHFDYCYQHDSLRFKGLVTEINCAVKIEYKIVSLSCKQWAPNQCTIIIT